MDKCPITVEPIHSLVDFNLETHRRKFKPLFLPQQSHAAKSTTYNMPHPARFSLPKMNCKMRVPIIAITPYPFHSTFAFKLMLNSLQFLYLARNFVSK
jgi:hypothetical protein